MNDAIANAAPLRRGEKKQRKREKRDVHGWIILDKPVGMTSTHAVSVIKRLFQARRAGHAGTLDPLASGCLPVALGEATKTVPFVMDGRKTYRFTVRWGEERDTDDAEGRVVATSDARPTPDDIRALLPTFTGTISQVPPRFSAVKIDGERAYDLARDGEVVELNARPVDIHRLELVEIPDADHAVLAAECGKGTYVRSIARDMGRALGCHGHVSALRRTGVGYFQEADTVSLERQQAAAPNPGASNQDATGQDGPGEPTPSLGAPGLGTPNPALFALLRPVSDGVLALPALSVSRADAARLARGQSVLLRGRDAPIMQGYVAVSTHGDLIALAEIEHGELLPRRVFNLGGPPTTG
jgi:tRNA pseudouridine55 synthase